MNRKFVWIAALAVFGVNLAVSNDADAQLLRRLMGRDCCCTPCTTTCCETNCVSTCATPCASTCATPAVATVCCEAAPIQAGCGCGLVSYAAPVRCGCRRMTSVACEQVSYGQGVGCESGCGQTMVGAGCPQGGCGGTVVVEAAPTTIEMSPPVEAPAESESVPEAPAEEAGVEGDREA